MDKTPLHFSAGQGDYEITKLLLLHGADVNAKDKENTTPLHEASWRWERKVVELLIDKGAKVNIKGVHPRALCFNGWTPLHVAAERGRNEVVEALLKAGADVNTKSDGGMTPLSVANENMFSFNHSGDPEFWKEEDDNRKYKETVELLKKYGAVE